MQKVTYAKLTADTARGPSAGLWGDCPWHDLVRDPNMGYAMHEDFLAGIVPTTALGYTVTAVNSGSIIHTDGGGGVLKLDSAGFNANDDGVQAQAVGEAWDPSTGDTLWFETRVQAATLAATPDQFLAGLATKDTTLIASGLLDVANNSHIVFYTEAGSTAGRIGFSVAKAGVESADVDLTGAAAVANSIWVKLGFKVFSDINGLRTVTPYINGVPYTAVTTTTYIPAEALAVSFVAQVEQNAVDAELLVDWWRCAVKLQA